METQFIHTIPVLPSQDISRDTKWYQEKMGMQIYFADKMYAVIYRENMVLHLQWHADTPDDPLLAGSVVRVLMRNIQPYFEELQERGCVTADKLRMNTPWNTNEFGFFDLTGNAIFIMEDVAK
jgi:hypothetical protein